MAAPTQKSAQQPKGFSLAMREFQLGLMDLAPLTLVVCLCTFIVTTAFMLWLYSPDGMKSEIGAYVPRSTRDAEGFATVEAVRLSQGSAASPALVILGSSAVAQMVGSGDPIRNFLDDRLSETWDVSILTTPLQSPLDQFALLDGILGARVETSPPLIVMMGVGMTRLGWTNDRSVKTAMEQRIGIRSDWMDAELLRLGGTPAPIYPISALDTAPFLIRNGLKSMVRLSILSPAKQVVDVYASGAAGANRGRDALLKSIEIGRASPNEYLELMGVLVERINSTPNTRLVFIEEPLSPKIVEVGGLADVLLGFRERMSAFAVDVGAEFWPVIQDVDLVQSDYFDDIHIRGGAPQELCQQRIVSGMSQLIEGLGMQ